MAISAGSKAPDFELASHLGGRVRLSGFRDKKYVLVAFHPLAWTPVCANQMASYQEDLGWFAERETHVLGISVDAVPAKAEWASHLGGLSFDLLSDFHPHGEVAAAFGVAREDGISDRAVFVIDKGGIIVFSKVYDIPELPDIGEVKQAIAQLVRPEKLDK